MSIISLTMVCVFGLGMESVKMGFVPLENRGRLAWERVAQGDRLGEAHPEVTRLLSHAAADKTEKVYIKAALDWLEGLLARGIEETDQDGLDRMLMREFDKQCYENMAGAHKGNTLFDAMIGCFPKMNGSFPRSNRCLKGWRKVRPPGERGPLPLEAAWYGAIKLMERGYIYPAWVVFLSVDRYLRGQDWKNLASCDVVSDSSSVALMLGVSTRGKEVEGGTNQGFVIGRGWIADGTLALRELTGIMGPIFPLTQSIMRNVWSAMWAREARARRPSIGCGTRGRRKTWRAEFVITKERGGAGGGST